MKLSISFLVLGSTLNTSQARTSLRRELAEGTTIPTAAVTTYVPTYNDVAFNETDDNGPEEPALVEEIDSNVTSNSSGMFEDAPEEDNGPKEQMGAPGNPEEIDTPEHNDTMADFFQHEKPELNDTIVNPMFHGDNDTFADEEDPKGHMNPGMFHGDNETFADEKDPEGHMQEMGPGAHGPKSFQDLVDDKCANFECPSASNSTCPTPPENVHPLKPTDMNMTEGMGPPEPLGMNMTEGMGPPEPLDMNMTEDMGPPEPLDMNMTDMNMTGPMEGHGPKHSPERVLKPHHKPEDLLACACCEGATVEEIADTGVDVSGLAFLVGYDPSAATEYDNGSSLNSLVTSTVVVGAAVLALFL